TPHCSPPSTGCCCSSTPPPSPSTQTSGARGRRSAGCARPSTTPPTDPTREAHPAKDRPNRPNTRNPIRHVVRRCPSQASDGASAAHWGDAAGPPKTAVTSPCLRNIPRADRPCPRRRRRVEVHRQQPNQQHQPSIGARMSLMSYWVFSWVNKLLAAWEYANARPRHHRLRGPRTSQNLRPMLSHRHSDFSKSQGAGSFRLGRQPSAEHPHLLGGF